MKVVGPEGSGKSTLAINQLSEHRGNFLIIGDKSNKKKRTNNVPMNHIVNVANCDEKDKILKGLEKTYEKLLEFKRSKNSVLVVMRDNKIVKIKP